MGSSSGSHRRRIAARVSVRLTAKGRRLLDAKRELVAAKRRELFESMTPAERAQAEGLLARLAELIEEL